MFLSSIRQRANLINRQGSVAVEPGKNLQMLSGRKLCVQCVELRTVADASERLGPKLS